MDYNQAFVFEKLSKCKNKVMKIILPARTINKISSGSLSMDYDEGKLKSQRAAVLSDDEDYQMIYLAD